MGFEFYNLEAVRLPQLPVLDLARPSEMLELISSACIHNNVRHHTELLEKSNKIKEGKTHSKPATKSLQNLCNYHFVKKGERIFFGKKKPSAQTFCVSFCKPLFKLSFKMTTKTKL